MASEQYLMLSRETVARLAGVTESRIDYWEKTGLVAPTVERVTAGNRRVRLYDFTAAMTILALAALRRKVSLQHLRVIVGHLRELQFRVPEVRFALVGNRVHFQLPDGTWSGVDDPGQIVLHEVLALEPLRTRLLTSSERAATDIGRTEKRRGVRGSKPVIAGTRVPVRSVLSFLEDGATDDEVLRAYPSLTPTDIDSVRTLSIA